MLPKSAPKIPVSPQLKTAWQDSTRYGSLSGPFLCRNSLSKRAGGKFCM